MPYWLVAIPLLVFVFAGYWALVERAHQLHSLARKERAARLATFSVHLEREVTKELDKLFEEVSRSEEFEELVLPPWALTVLVYDKSGLIHPRVDYGPTETESLPAELSEWHLRAERFEQEEDGFEQALLSFQQAALVATSNGARAQAIMGSLRCLRRMGEFDRALEEAKRLIELYGSYESPLGVSYRLLAQELIVSIHIDRAKVSLTDFNRAGQSLLSFAKDIILNNHKLSEETLVFYEDLLTDLVKRLKEKSTENKASQDEIFRRLAFWSSAEAKQLSSVQWQTFAPKHSLKASLEKGYLLATRYGRQSIVLYIDGHRVAQYLNELVSQDDIVVRVRQGGHQLSSLSGLVIDAPVVRDDTGGLVPSLSFLALLAFLAITGIFVLRNRTNRAIEVARERSAFLARFSHELKTPLTSMRLLTEGMVEGHVTNNEKREKHLRLVAQESARLERLLQNVFMYSRSSQEELGDWTEGREQDLDELVQESLSLFTALHGAELFNYEPSYYPLTVKVDGDGLKRAIINILDNALRYSPEGKAIDIKTAKVGEDCLLTIRDHGVGIADSNEMKIFTPFFSTEKSNKGLGLGLHICQQIVIRNGGKVGYDKPNDGQGASFTITLPHYKEWVEK